MADLTRKQIEQFRLYGRCYTEGDMGSLLEPIDVRHALCNMALRAAPGADHEVCHDCGTTTGNHSDDCPEAAMLAPPAGQGATPVDIVFDGPPGPEGGRFVEVESPPGKGISFGKWLQREDGYWVLRIAPAHGEREASAAHAKAAFTGYERGKLAGINEGLERAVNAVDSVGCFTDAGALRTAIKSNIRALAAPAKQPEGGEDWPAKVRHLVDVYFAPWGAGKGAEWDGLTGDRDFSGERAMQVIRQYIAESGRVEALPAAAVPDREGE